MKTSVIIPTYNGADKITFLLEALSLQSYKDFETIIVIDGSTDNTVEQVEKYRNALKELKIVVQENKGRAAARNTGANNSSGEVLIFFDDDVVPVPNAVELHVNHHASTADSILVGFLLMDNKHDPDNDFFNYRFFTERKWEQLLPSSDVHLVTVSNYHFTSGNLSLRKALFISLDGFDERLSDSEDLDLSLRALKKNIPIWFNKNIFAWHRDFADVGKYIRRQKEYKAQRHRLLDLHPEYYQLSPSSFNLKLDIPFFKRLLSRLFIFNGFWKLLFKSFFYKSFFPRYLRYRLYDIVVYSSVLNYNEYKS